MNRFTKTAWLALLGLLLVGEFAATVAQPSLTKLPATPSAASDPVGAATPLPALSLPPAVVTPSPSSSPLNVATGVGAANTTAIVIDERNNATPTNPGAAGRAQEPAVRLEWNGPAEVKVNRPADYTITVRNSCTIPVQQVMIRVRIPTGMRVLATEPKALVDRNVLMWELATLKPRQERNLQIRLLPDGKGSVACQAWVTFTGSAALRVKVTEPKLVIKTQAPDRVLAGDSVTLGLLVSNPGDGPAEQVKIHASLSDGLEYARGKTFDYEVGTLAAGESRNVQVVCIAKTGGEQRCEALAEAEGNMKAQDHCALIVIRPRLSLETLGPKLRYLDRRAVYTFRVSNPGDAPAANVSIDEILPPGFKFLSASDGGRHDLGTKTVSWFVGELGPGQRKEVKMDVVAINTGRQRHRAVAQAARNLRAENEFMTHVEGLSALLLEVVDTEDPIEVGADTAYEIRITNTGSKPETDIKLVCTIPEKMAFRSARAPGLFHEQGKEIVFDAIPNLAPRSDIIFRINVKALTAGDVRFKAQISSTNLIEPVIEMESTRIYDD